MACVFDAAAIRVRHLATGSDATELLFTACKKHKGRLPLPAPIFGDPPCAEATEDTEALAMILTDFAPGCDYAFPTNDRS